MDRNMFTHVRHRLGETFAIPRNLEECEVALGLASAFCFLNNCLYFITFQHFINLYFDKILFSRLGQFFGIVWGRKERRERGKTHEKKGARKRYELHDPSLRGALEIDGSCVKFDRDGRCLGAVHFKEANEFAILENE